MKKCILLIIAGINSLSAADKDGSKPAKPVEFVMQKDPLSTLPPEIKNMIIVQLSSAGFIFEQSIKNIKSLAQVNTIFYQYLNDPHIVQVILTSLSKQFKIPETAVAFALGSHGALQWLQEKYPQETFLSVFNDIFQDQYLNSSFINSHYFTELVMKLSEKQFNDKAAQKLTYPNLEKKMALLLAARADVMTNDDIMRRFSDKTDQFWQRLYRDSSPQVAKQLLILQKRLKAIKQHEGYESGKTQSGSEYVSDYGSDFD